jgi:hypothetical protein
MRALASVISVMAFVVGLFALIRGGRRVLAATPDSTTWLLPAVIAAFGAAAIVLALHLLLRKVLVDDGLDSDLELVRSGKTKIAIIIEASGVGLLLKLCIDLFGRGSPPAWPPYWLDGVLFAIAIGAMSLGLLHAHAADRDALRAQAARDGIGAR